MSVSISSKSWDPARVVPSYHRDKFAVVAGRYFRIHTPFLKSTDWDVTEVDQYGHPVALRHGGLFVPALDGLVEVRALLQGIADGLSDDAAEQAARGITWAAKSAKWDADRAEFRATMDELDAGLRRLGIRA